MLTKERTSKLKYAAVVLALLAVLVCCLVSCGDATPVSIEYVEGSATKVEYNQGDAFDCAGAKIKVTYDNGAVETKDVTADMVGNAPLMLGVTTIGVTYSENGATVVGYIPVTVKDPFGADKQAAITGLYAIDDVANNSTDKGVATLIRDYTAKINQAGSKDAIDAVVNNFKSAVADYLADKQAVLTELNAVDLSGLYSTFVQDILSLKENAIANIKAASTIDEAEDYLASFKVAVQNKLDEQKAHEGDGNNQGQILDKIDILNMIEAYEAKTQLLMNIVEKAYDNGRGEITADVYNLKMYGDGADVKGYEYVMARLAYWEKYITLAINIAGVMDSIDGEVKALITTPVDEIAALLSASEGITVLPIEYTWDEAAAKYVDGEDATGDLLADIAAHKTAGATEFGTAGLQALLNAYGVNTATGNDIITELVDAIQTKYNALLTVRGNAAAADLIDLIDTAFNTADGGAKKVAVDAAWDALKTWATANGILSLDATITEFNNNLVWDKTFAGEYFVELIDGKWNTTIDDESWSNYEINYDYVELYYVPNIDLLIEATQAQDAYEVKVLEEAIATVILSYTNAADDKKRIEAAQDALDAYLATYGQEIYDKYDLGTTQDEVTDAADQYTTLEGMAKAVNDAIDAYEALLAAESRDVVRSDYEAEEAVLKAAYDLYCEFAAANTDAGVIYTDVIENSDATTVTNNETNLVAYMDTYVALAYAEERHVQADKIINAAWLVREDNIPTDQTLFRKALQEYKQGKIDSISVGAAYDYDKTGKTNFNYDELLAANIQNVKDAAADVAGEIAGATYENGNLVLPTAP